MRILCVTPSYYPAFKFGGPIFSVHSINKALAQKGFDVTVYTTNAGLDAAIPVNTEVIRDEVKVFYFTFTKAFDFIGASGWQYSLPLTRALRKNLTTFDSIYLVSIWNYPTLIAAYYCRRYGKSYIISPRGHLYPYALGKKAWKKILYYFLFARKSLTNAAFVHYTTEDEAQQCHASLKLRNGAVVIPNAIDISEFSPTVGRQKMIERFPVLAGKKVILFLGRLHWKKGFDLLAKAYGVVARVHRNVHLLVAGCGDKQYEETVKRWFKKEGVFDSVTFMGELTGKEKSAVFSVSDIFVLPSYSENFGVSVVEAMAARVPVVITDAVGIYPDVKAYNAGIVTPCDAERIAGALLKLLDNDEDRRVMGIAGRRLVESKFSLDVVIEQMIAMHQRIAERNQKDR